MRKAADLWRHHEERICSTQFFKACCRGALFAVGRRDFVEHKDTAVLALAEKEQVWRGAARTLGQVVRMLARGWTETTAAARNRLKRAEPWSAHAGSSGGNSSCRLAGLSARFLTVVRPRWRLANAKTNATRRMSGASGTDQKIPSALHRSGGFTDELS